MVRRDHPGVLAGSCHARRLAAVDRQTVRVYGRLQVGTLVSADGARVGLDGAHGGLDGARVGLDGAHGGLDGARVGLDGAHGGLEDTRGGLDGTRGGMGDDWWAETS